MAEKTAEKQQQEKVFRHAGLATVLFLVLASLPLIYKVLTVPVDPRIVFLSSHDNAQWIHIQRDFEIKGRIGNETITYRKRFKLANGPANAVLTVQAVRSASVMIDGRMILPYNPDLNEWKTPRSVAIGDLSPGDHEILIRVFNENGPAVLLAYCKACNVFTGEGWEASADGIAWRPAMRAARTKELELPREFPATYRALLSLAPFYVPLFLCVFLATLVFPSRGRMLRGMSLSPSAVRWVLLGLWAALAMNNIMKIDLGLGYDADAHYDYILHVSRTWSVPLATQGWQMFQSPLYYFISAVFYVFFSLFSDKVTAGYLLRVVPLLCGALQVELCYRAATSVFPDRKDLRIIGTVLGGLLPMNIYISHFAGNEPLAGLLSAAVLVMGVSFLQMKDPPTTRQWLLLGVTLGLALLSKVTAVLLVLPLLLLIYSLSAAKEGRHRKAWSGGLVAFSTALIVSGWYFLRNWMELGTPFLGGWESFPWWQDPGYRTAHDLLSFGISLSHPIYSAIHGFWDSIYSTFWLDGFLSSADLFTENPPPWNYTFMLSGTLLSLVPSAAIVFGMMRTFARPSRSMGNGTLLCGFSIFFYFAVLLYLYISLPIYSTAKATYTLGLIPCYVVMGLTGLEPLMRILSVRAFLYAVLSCWAVSAYLSFFIW